MEALGEESGGSEGNVFLVPVQEEETRLHSRHDCRSWDKKLQTLIMST